MDMISLIETSGVIPGAVPGLRLKQRCALCIPADRLVLIMKLRQVKEFVGQARPRRTAISELNATSATPPTNS
jgi:hypothetical protein